METRNYRLTDCQEVYQLFYDTVHSINTADYDKNQVDSWARSDISKGDLELWCRSLLDSHSLVMVNSNDEKILGFGNITREGYLDRLYVHKDYNGQGIGTILTNQLETYAIDLGLKEIVTQASITARPFFEKRGYKLIKEQTVERNNQHLTNFLMKKTIR